MKTFIINNLMVHSEKETYKNGTLKSWMEKLPKLVQPANTNRTMMPR